MAVALCKRASRAEPPALGELDRNLRANLRRSDFSSEHQFDLFVEFIRAASSPETLSSLTPLRFNDEGKSKLNTDELLRTITNHQYGFITLETGREVVVVYTAAKPIPGSDVVDVTSRISKYLRPIDSMFGHFFQSAWLHVQFDSRSDHNRTNTNNIWFTSPSVKDDDTALAHELVHTFNSRWQVGVPTFLSEGLADVIAIGLTGHGGYERFATGNKVSPLITASNGISPAYFAEGGNGALFFGEVIEEIGVERFLVAISSAYHSEGGMGLSILRSLKKQTPNREKLERLFVKWVNDYEPNSP